MALWLLYVTVATRGFFIMRHTHAPRRQYKLPDSQLFFLQAVYYFFAIVGMELFGGLVYEVRVCRIAIDYL